MKKPYITKFWMIITLAFLLVGLFITAWLITLQAAEKDTLSRYNRQQYLVVAGTAIGVQGFFEDLSTGLVTLALLPEIQYFDQSRTRDALAQKLDELKSQGITDIGVLNIDGVGAAFAAKTEAEGIDYSWKTYFKTLRSNDLVDGSNILILDLDATSPADLGITIAVPIFETAVDANHPDPSGKFIGAVVANLALDTLVQRYLIPFKPPGSGDIFLVDHQYDIIWSSVPEMIMTSILSDQLNAFAPLVDQMGSWGPGASAGGFFQFQPSADQDDHQLVAFAPVDLGQQYLMVGVITPEVVVRQTSFINFQGQQLVFIISVLTILLGVIVGGLVLSREVTRRFQVEGALKKSEMEQAIIAERVRLAGDLHDSVTQDLYGILLHADAAVGQLTAGHPAKAESYLDEIKAAGKEGLAEMRSLIFELHPSVLEEDGLAAALETRLFAVEKRAGLTTKFQSSVAGPLPLEIENGLYRVAQEALNNALKHAGAQHISVYLDQDGHIITLEIVDDGCGFDLQSTQSSTGGMGLSSIAERVSRIDGDLTIDSQLDQGTRLFVEVKV